MHLWGHTLAIRLGRSGRDVDVVEFARHALLVQDLTNNGDGDFCSSFEIGMGIVFE